MQAPGTISLGLILLAAGQSSRMGRPKLLLPWGATTILGHLLTVAEQIGARQIAVVTAVAAAELAAELDRFAVARAHRIVNPDAASGMFSSIRCAARWPGWDSSLTHWLIALGDQPHLRLDTWQSLLAFAQKHPAQICQPGHGGQPKHPVLLPLAVFRRLAGTREITLKDFLLSHAGEVALLELDDPGLELDLDTPADYELARRMVFGS